MAQRRMVVIIDTLPAGGLYRKFGTAPALPLPARIRNRVYPISALLVGRSRINPTSAERVGVRGRPPILSVATRGDAPSPGIPRYARNSGLSPQAGRGEERKTHPG